MTTMLKTTDLRETMRQHATAVAVITTRDARGQASGFCATSLASVSLRPPIVSFAVALDSTSGRAWENAACGLIHLLRSDQADVAAAFATSGPTKFTDVGWSPGPAQQPLIDGVLAWLLVGTRTRLVLGDHRLIVADVLSCVVTPGLGPLIHHNGTYGGVCSPMDTTS
jgi:flavin reductase (DIM6/NTAB) family NADH-FMN oxidoreductase RutF